MDNNKIYVALNANVFVKEIQQEIRQGSMLLPDSLDKDFLYGEVISVADGYFEHGKFVPSCVQVGDIVVFPKISSTKVTFNDIQALRVMQQDIVAKQVKGTVIKEND